MSFNKQKVFYRKSKDKKVGTAIGFNYSNEKLYLEIAKIVSGTDNYDWAKKIVFSLSGEECSNILYYLSHNKNKEEKLSFYHTKDHSDKQHYTTLIVGLVDTGVAFSFNKNGSEKNYFIFNYSEIPFLKIIFENVIIMSLNWKNSENNK
jgi:hypothetical protein